MNNADYLQISSIYYSVRQEDNNHSSDKIVEILKDVSFSVSEGSLTSIFGPNGSGKSTLLKAVANLLDPKLTRGSITHNEEQVPNPNETVSFIFQDYNSSLMPWLNCRDNIALPLNWLKNRKDRRTKDPEMITQLDRYLEDWKYMNKEKRKEKIEKFVTDDLKLNDNPNAPHIPLDNYPDQCSGGQKQMTAIARALIVKPGLLLMDEAFGALDYTTRLKLEEKLLEIWNKQKNTILMVSHDLDESVFLSDRIVVISSRPARVVDIIDVDLPRPRELKSSIASKKFQWIRNRVLNSFLQGQEDMGIKVNGKDQS